MDTPSASNRLQSTPEDDLDKTTTGHSTTFGESSLDADESLSSNLGEKEKFTSSALSRSVEMPQKKKCVLELFPWLDDIEKSIQKALGSVTEVKSKTILNAMDFLIRKLFEDSSKYCKSARLSILLARYVREFLYSYRHLYKGFELVCIVFISEFSSVIANLWAQKLICIT